MQKEVIIAPNAERELKKINLSDRKKVWTAIKQWRSGEIRLDIEKIKAAPDFFRLRIGNYRVVYYPLSPERVVLLLVRDRKKAYKGLGDLQVKLETALRKLKIA